MTVLTLILAMVLTAACAGTADLPTAPSAIVPDTLTSASHGNPEHRIHVHIQVASWEAGAGYFLQGVAVTMTNEAGETWSGVTTRKGNSEINLPGDWAGHTIVITMTKDGYWPVTATAKLTKKPQQIFQFAMARQY